MLYTATAVYQFRAAEGPVFTGRVRVAADFAAGVGEDAVRERLTALAVQKVQRDRHWSGAAEITAIEID